MSGRTGGPFEKVEVSLIDNTSREDTKTCK